MFNLSCATGQGTETLIKTYLLYNLYIYINYIIYDIIYLEFIYIYIIIRLNISVISIIFMKLDI